MRSDPQRSVTYADLVGGKPFNRKFEQVAYNGGIELPRKSADTRRSRSARDDYRIVGTRVPRPDIAEKVARHLSVRSARPSARDASRPRRVAPRTGRARHQQSDRGQHRRVVDQGHSRGADRSPPQLRRRGGGARVGCRPRGETVEGHLGAVRVGASRSRGLVRQLQVGQDQRPDRHRHRRCGRRAVPAVPTSSPPRIAGRTSRTGRWRRTARSRTSRETVRS